MVRDSQLGGGVGTGGGLSESRPLSVGAVGSFLSHPAASLLSNKHANNETQNSNNIIQQTNNKTSKDITEPASSNVGAFQSHQAASLT